MEEQDTEHETKGKAAILETADRNFFSFRDTKNGRHFEIAADESLQTLISWAKYILDNFYPNGESSSSTFAG